MLVLKAGGYNETLFDGFAESCRCACFGGLERSVCGVGIEHRRRDNNLLVTALSGNGECSFWSGRGHKPNLLAGMHRDWLLARAATNLTLRGLVAELADRGVKVDYVQVWRFARADGWAFKKSVLPAEQLRP